MYQPSLDQVRRYAAGNYQVVPVWREMLSDNLTPIQALRILKNAGRHCYMLESASPDETWGRYTFLGFRPKLEVTCLNGVVRMKTLQDVQTLKQSPQEALRSILSNWKSPRIPELPPFTGGLVGYFSYDYIQYAESSLRLDAEDQEGFQDLDLMLFDQVIAFDHYRQKIILIANAQIQNLEQEYARTLRELDEIAVLLRTGRPAPNPPGKILSPLRPLFGKEEYCQKVRQAKEFIREGDIFQVVLSNRLEADYSGSLLNAYRILRTTNPSPYMFYFASDDLELAGASPETLISLKDGRLYTYPLAGTRPRGANPEEDLRLEQELLSDEKELAEHNMLVDLGRNDLGKISRFGTVQVEEYQKILRFSHVMHIGSTVTGQIRPNKDAVDAIDAILPAGTLSGAPKVRACQIINQLENNKRGVYGGAVGYLDFTGNMDVCIAIRLAFQKNHKVFIRSGAGIVADSDPETEYQECLNKAQAVQNALQAAQSPEFLAERGEL